MTKPASARAVPAAAPVDGIDGPVAVRAASRGFTVLAIGAVVQPIVGQLLPPLGYVWLVVVAVAAFVASAWTAGRTPSPVKQGVAGALGAYALMVPLVYMSTGTVIAEQLVFTTLTAVVVGAATGWARARAAA